jgi:hypothetical protein
MNSRRFIVLDPSPRIMDAIALVSVRGGEMAFKGKLVCGVFRAKYRPFLCLFLLQKATKLRTSAPRGRDVAYFTAAVCATRDSNAETASPN